MSRSSDKPMVKKTYGKQRISFSDNALKLQDQNECILNDLTNLQEDKCFKKSESKERVITTATDDSTTTKLKIQKQKFIADFFSPTYDDDDTENKCIKKRRKNNYTIPRFNCFNSENIESSSSTEKKRRIKENEQLFLDFGQKSFNSYTCPDCKMSYNQGTAEDETLHAKYHKAAIGGIVYTSYKNQVFLQQYPEDNGSRVVMLTFNQSNPFEKKKIHQILNLINAELCAIEMNEKKLEQCKIFLYITSNKKVVGCTVAETIPQAYRVIDADDNGITENSERMQIGMASDGSIIFYCTKPVRAVCGVSRMWVSKKLRRRGIATRLLDNIRIHFLFGFTLEPRDLAFSQPTGDGKAFASHYTNSREFLVYVEQ
ncbi:hypothetical protein Glove_391g4 [Diversispora epigaea]|uniref:N-acetyltransferase ESCO acetyl-transferase domain-containing protein n=1 Tax=Diversispora epigaea TaxID=1348612 RepID=A0A397H752_9GLOM|nr:hypothetical protein Glove_391g4 [Diversispora epigaea]